MNWSFANIGEVCEVNPRLASEEYPEQSTLVSFVPMSAVDEVTGTIVSKKERRYSEVARGFTYFRDGDVLFAKITPCMENGKAAVAADLTNGIGFGSTEFHILRAAKLILPKWLFYFVRQRGFRAIAKANFTGTAGQQRVPASFVRAAKIPVPPLSEQARIIEILDQADALRRKRAEADSKCEEISPAYFYQMFGDPATNPKSWTKCRLGDLLAETVYGTSAPSNSDGRGTVVVRMGNICSDGWIDLGNLKHIEIPKGELARLRLQRGDLLFNRTNSRELVGKTGIWLDTTLEAVPASYLIRLRTRAEVALPEFVWAYMNTAFTKRLILDMARRAIGMANINATEVRSMPAFLPPLDEQRKFAIALSRTEKMRRARLELGTRLELLATVLSAQAFSGTLTAKWREGHLKELLSEMADQARALGQGSEETKEPASP